jgi:hypothetical protein
MVSMSDEIIAKGKRETGNTGATSAAIGASEKVAGSQPGEGDTVDAELA